MLSLDVFRPDRRRAGLLRAAKAAFRLRHGLSDRSGRDRHRDHAVRRGRDRAADRQADRAGAGPERWSVNYGWFANEPLCRSVRSHHPGARPRRGSERHLPLEAHEQGCVREGETQTTKTMGTASNLDADQGEASSDACVADSHSCSPSSSCSVVPTHVETSG